LLLWSAAGRNEKGSDLNVGHLPARRKIGLVPHENPTAIGIDGEQPPIAVGTDVNGSGPNGHAEFYSSCSTLALAHICGEGPLRTEGSAGRALESEPLWGRGSRSNRCGFQQRKGHPGAWPDGLSDELPAFAPVPFTLYQSANITKERRSRSKKKSA
jgi:hypothetical protein